MSLFSSVEQTVREAGRLVLDRRLSSSVRKKSPTDYVTKTDLTVQSFIRERLYDLFPDVDFLGEEQEQTELSMDRYVWILDPVDGTTNLVHGIDHCAVSLALCEDGKPTAAFIYDPYKDEMFTAFKGEGACLNGDRIHVSEVSALGDSLIGIGTFPAERSQSSLIFDRIRHVFDRCIDIRRMGAASLDLCYVACGRLDGYFEDHLKPWDYAAGWLLVNEAGGLVTGYDGTDFAFRSDREIVAAGCGIFSELLQTIQEKC